MKYKKNPSEEIQNQHLLTNI